jgi:hypothetical protein
MADAGPIWLKVSNEFDYRPWPEIRHTAAVFRKMASDAPSGGAHLLRAALVFTAFSVEAFVQQLGPDVFTTQWPVLERKPVLAKLKLIAKQLSIDIDFGRQPWHDIELLFTARDSLAHAKPRKELFEIHCPARDLDSLLMDLPKIVRERIHPNANLEWLSAISLRIDDALRPVWVAAYKHDHQFLAAGSTMSSAAAE